MHPVLFTIAMPEALRGVLPASFSVPTYGAAIFVGTLCGWLYLWRNRASASLDDEDVPVIVFLAAAGSFVGGKLFFFGESPARYWRDPAAMVRNLGHGFVFFGSLVTAAGVILIYLRRRRIAIRPVLDLVAMSGCFAQGVGKLGCFLAGCCHGRATESALGVVFRDPSCAARPLNTPLVPVQLADALLVAFAFACAAWVRSQSRSEWHAPGRAFLTYVIVYSVGRAITELYRGDVQRGFVLGGALSHSQAIAIVALVLCSILWVVWRDGSANRARAA